MAETDIRDEVLAESPELLREQAVRRLKKRRDFHSHVFVYVSLNIVMWGIWAVIGRTSGSWYPWPLWITLPWGLGVIFNAWDVYVRRPITESEIHREMEKLGGRR